MRATLLRRITPRRLRAALAAAIGRRALDQSMDDEFALHIDLLTEDLVRKGATRDEAERQARVAFGNTTIVKENARALHGLHWLDTLGQDLRFTARTLRRSIAFTAVAVLSLGFGIGAVTTIFSVIDTLDFRPLPYAGSERLVWLGEVAPPDDPICGGCTQNASAITARDWLSHARSYEATVIAAQTAFTWQHDDVDESPGAGLATPGLLSLFNLHPILGRDLAPADTLPDAPPVALLSYDFWQSRFAGNRQIVGTTIRAGIGRLTAAPQMVTIIGVAPREFQAMPEVKVWGALAANTRAARSVRDATVMARLAPRVSLAAANAELQGLAERLARQYPDDYRGWGARVAPLRDRLGWGAGQGRGALFGVTMAVLLIAVLNVTGLLLARAASRQPEFALRAALGAGGGRLFRQLLVEGAVVGLLGGAAGVVCAYGGIRLAAQWFAVQRAGLDLSIDHRMLAFTATLSLLVGIAAGLAPALRTSKTDGGTSLRPRVTAGSRASRTSNILITVQIALAFVLLTAASLLSRDFLELRYLDLGYEPRGLFGTQLSAPREQWANPDPWKAVATETRARVAKLPGIQSTSLTYENAMHPGIVRSDVSGVSTSAAAAPRVQAVDGDFFATWKIPMLAGRAFTAGDRAGALPVAVVNDAGAAALWPGQNPIGRRVLLSDSGSTDEWLTVVGVSGDVENGAFSRRHAPVVYRPFAQAPLYHASARLNVRLAANRPDVTAAVQSTIREVSGRSAAPLQSDEDELGARFRTSRLNAIALDVFAGFGLLLAMLGIYGSIAFGVSQRTREIGIRTALGATRASVLRLIARRGLLVAVVGSAVGVASSVALTRVFRSFVTATSTANPWIFLTSVVTVLGLALVATYLPARRAADVDPLIALRVE